MHDIAVVNINALDLNLLKAFLAVYEERNVTRAAERVGLAQSSLSNALARLRARFDDELFVRMPRTMEPTRRAHAIAAPIAEALRLIEAAASDPAPFDPATAAGDVAISWPDTMLMGAGQGLLRRIRRDAPGIVLHFRGLDKDVLWDEMDRGEVHLGVGVFPEVPRRFEATALDEDEFVCLVPKDHPATRDLTLEGYLAADHIVTSFRPTDASSVIDRSLHAMGRSRRVVLTVAQFSALPDLLEAANAIATLPRSAARSLSANADLVVRPLPVEVPGWTNTLVMSPQAAADPQAVYVRDAVVRSCLG